MVQMLRLWPLHIPLDENSQRAIHIQIYDAVVAGIRSRRLPAGSPLPGSRTLAQLLDVNRKTVQLAYDELIAAGWVTAEGRRGTFVSLRLPSAQRSTAETGTKRHPEPVRSSQPVPKPPPSTMIVFDDGAPDTRLVPVSALAQAYHGALRRLSRSNRLADEHALGNPELRQSISGMLNFNRGMATMPERICLTRGSQMAIFLAARILTGPGRTAVLEEPGYGQARTAFRRAGADLALVPVDGEGMRVDILEELCQTRKVACVYVTPHHQFPTTVSLSPERRRWLLELSERYGFTIVEDDYDHEFHFASKPLLPLANRAPDARIVYIGSFSKLLSPHVRSGFITGPAGFIRDAASWVAQIDRLGDPVKELALSELINSGTVQRHNDKARQVYDQRRQGFADLLRQNFGTGVRFSVPDGGLAYWVEFDAPVNTAVFMARARVAGVRLLPARQFWTGRPSVGGTRIGYAHMTGAEVAEPLRRLGRVLRQAESADKTGEGG
ncbi:GntR family transcriptional regulator [Azospirillum palustre]|uniref:GntR family transcriptional regulator n=2 Tax=Azospirillum palustre TaxID=2044885 RepID=A0A2B8B4L5_9PROT|nr:GntR family transcriptional regulator [Azospirillum palustre]